MSLGSGLGYHLPSWRYNSGKWIVQGKVALRNLDGGSGLTVPLPALIDRPSRSSCHDSGVLHGHRD